MTQANIDRQREQDDALMNLVHEANNVLIAITNFSADPTIAWRLQNEYAPNLLAAVARVRRSRK